MLVNVFYFQIKKKKLGVRQVRIPSIMINHYMGSCTDGYRLERSQQATGRSPTLWAIPFMVFMASRLWENHKVNHSIKWSPPSIFRYQTEM